MQFNANGPSENLNIKIGTVTLPVVRSTKFLGVFLDEKLTWTEHVRHLQLKLKTRFCLLRKGKNVLSPHAKKILYFAQIHSNLLYGLLMWGNMASRSELMKLQKLQNRCVQTILPNMNVEKIYNSLEILKIGELVRLENCKAWYRFYNGTMLRKLKSIMAEGSCHESLAKDHKYMTCRKNELNLPKASSQGYRKSFLVKGLLDFNKLPQKIKKLSSFSQFVLHCKKNIILARPTA